MFFEPQESRAIVLTDTVCVHTQLCLTICDPMDCSQSGSSVHGISQARILECYYWLLQGFFLTQGLNPSLLHWQADSEGSNKSTIIFISLSLCDDFHLFFSLWKSITTTPRLVRMDIQIVTLCLYWHLLLSYFHPFLFHLMPSCLQIIGLLPYPTRGYLVTTFPHAARSQTR